MASAASHGTRAFVKAWRTSQYRSLSALCGGGPHRELFVAALARDDEDSVAVGKLKVGPNLATVDSLLHEFDLVQPALTQQKRLLLHCQRDLAVVDVLDKHPLSHHRPHRRHRRPRVRHTRFHPPLLRPRAIALRARVPSRRGHALRPPPSHQRPYELTNVEKVRCLLNYPLAFRFRVV